MKNLKNLGQTLNANEQKQINGGSGPWLPPRQTCTENSDCSLDVGDPFKQFECINGYCH